MADNALTDSTLVTYSVLVDGQEIPGHYLCISLSVSRSINKIASARLEYMDGGSSESDDFSLSNKGLLDPGKEITIKAGYESQEDVIFEGIIIKHSLNIDRSGNPYVMVDCKDKAVKLTVGRKNTVFKDVKDSDVISELAKNSSLKAKVSATSTEHPELVQHHASDWDFILMRAEVNGLLVRTVNGELIAEAPGNKKVLKVGYGTGFVSFNGEIDSRSQYKSVVSKAWDFSTQSVLEGTGSASAESSQGDLKSDKLAEVLGLDEFRLQTPSTTNEAILKNWASSRLTRSRLSKVTGSLKIRGNAKAEPGTLISIDGLSDHFNGDAFIGSINHILEDGNWVTEIGLGLSNETYAEEVPLIESPAAGGTIPPINGLQIGVVKQIHEDPDGNHRVQVTLPTLEQDNMPIWARLSSFYASNGSGMFFYPEIGDEVVLGFLNDDPLSPVILGAMYSKKLVPKYTPEEENGTKSIFTKGELEIQFNDKDKILTIHTPEGNKLVLDDKNKNVTIEDTANKNKLVMSDAGISLEADKDIKISAKGNITLESTGQTDIKATKDLNAEGMNVSLKGTTKFAAEGTQAELKGSATTTIKGAMVQIN
ncbi:type VI secretion system tip protein VgrG [Fulvivirga sp. RKSG066]|uniref:type VI secretion system tip protein VgrG n=1 Tax=Fulvivirga aurantia TaxID=2529383 RepID=UPI0012BB9757|nr:type VI secretion system tip protein VgrG [Fulvivirga aurantia]MTI22457.1 type VI secretion system tip protein VgrG [Fulvivirga aurantia]